MSEPKAKNTYTYYGAGFPVKLINFPTKKVAGETVIDVDFNKLDFAIAELVLRKPALLSGHEIKFLRTVLNLSMAAFGACFEKTAPAIKKWEDLGEGAIRSLETDFAIRSLVASKLSLEHQKDITFAVHRFILESGKYWRPEPMRLPYQAMKDAVARARGEIPGITQRCA